MLILTVLYNPARVLASAFISKIDEDDLEAIESREAEVIKLASLDDTDVLHGIHHKVDTLDAKLVRLIDTNSMNQKVVDENKLNDLVAWLSLVPVARHHNVVSEHRIPGSGAWLLNHTDFRDWISSSSSSILLLHGIRGGGKSTVFSVVVDQLFPHQGYPSPTPPCGFFYCQNSPSEPSRALASSILRSIVRQLSVNPSDGSVHQEVVSTYEKETAAAQKARIEPGKLNIDGCVALILSITSTNPVYIAIDAVDELEETERAVLVEALQQIIALSASVVKVFLTSRDNTQLLALLEHEARIRVSSKHNGTDVDAFVQLEIDKAVRQKRLLNGNISSDLVVMMSQELRRGSGEMFLWAKLQLDFLCKKKTEHDVRTTLVQGLSGILDQLYDRALSNVLALDPIAKRIMQHVFTWLLFGRQTLHLDLIPSILLWDPALSSHATISSQLDIADICHNLVVVQPNTNIVTFCHSSVRDFMERQKLFSAHAANALLATLSLRQCIAGPTDVALHFDIEGTSLVTDFYHYAAVYWPDHVRQATNTEGQGDCSTPKDDCISSVCAETTNFIFADARSGIRPAFIVWMEWIRQSVLSALPHYHPLKGVMELVLNSTTSPVHTACVYGLTHVLRHMISISSFGKADLCLLSETGHTPLYLAASFGHSDAVALLLSHGVDLSSPVCGTWGTPMKVASFRGQIETVRILLECQQQHDPASLCEAYTAACRGGHEDIAKTLAREVLDAQQTSVNLASNFYDTAIQQAIEAGFRDLVSWLMTPSIASRAKSGSDAEIREPESYRRRDMLLTCIQRGQVGVLRTLLRLQRPNGHSKQDVPANALALAALEGHIHMLVYLYDGLGFTNLESEEDVELQSPFGSALRGASMMGYDRVVRQLLAWGANPKGISKQGSNVLGDSLQAAAQNGHTHILKLLVAEGADVNQTGPPKGTSLQAAAYFGHREAIEYLLDQGADMYLSGQGGSNDALHAAVEGGHEEFAAVLLQRGYRLQTGESLPYVARGDDPHGSSSTLRKKDRSSNTGVGQHPSDGESDVEFSEDEDGNETQPHHGIKSSGFVSDKQEDLVLQEPSAMVLAAGLGSIPTLRQELLLPEPFSDGTVRSSLVEQAFNAAAVRGQVQSLEVLTGIEGTRHLGDPIGVLAGALTTAAAHGREAAARLICEKLADRQDEMACQEVAKQIWGRALSVAASSGSMETLLVLLQCRICQPPSASLFELVADAVKRAVRQGHTKVATLLWDFLLDSETTMQKKTGTSATSLLDASLNTTTDTTKENHGMALGCLLTAAVESRSTSAVCLLLDAMDQQAVNADAIMPAFASACRHSGLGSTLSIILSRGDGSLSVDTATLFNGAYTASIFGRVSSLCALLDELTGRDFFAARASTKSSIETLLIGAAVHGQKRVLRLILETERFRKLLCDIKLAINDTLFAATRGGHVEIASYLCQEQAADIRALSGCPPEDIPHLDRQRRLALAVNAMDLLPLKNLGIKLPIRQRVPGPPGYWDFSLDGGAHEGDSLRLFQEQRRNRGRRGLANGLHAALTGFYDGPARSSSSRPEDPYAEVHAPSHENTSRQESLVAFMLDRGCDPNEPDATGRYPIDMAARWANERVVQVLLEAGASLTEYDSTDECSDDGSSDHWSSDGESNYYQERGPHPIILAAQRESPNAFAMVMQFLKAGASLPTTGSKGNQQLTPDILSALQCALEPFTPSHKPMMPLEDGHPFTSEQAAKFMNSGMRAFLKIIASGKPSLLSQQRDKGVFGIILVIAATGGDNSTVKQLLKHGVPAMSLITTSQDSALGGAAQFGHLKVIKTLLDAGAVATRCKQGGFVCRTLAEPVVKTVISGQMEALRLLVERGGANLGRVWSNDPMRRDFRCSISGKDPFDRSLQELALESGNIEMLRYVLEADHEGPDMAVLTRACSEGKGYVVACLLAAFTAHTEANPELRLENNGQPLYGAARNGHTGIVQQLLEHPSGNFKPGQDSGIGFGVPLIIASSRGHLDVTRLLLEKGVDPNQQPRRRSQPRGPDSAAEGKPWDSHDDDYFPSKANRHKPAPTALSEACKNGHVEIVKLLVSYGAVLSDGHPEEAPEGPRTQHRSWSLKAGLPNSIAVICEGSSPWSSAMRSILELLLERAASSLPRERCVPMFKEAMQKAALAHNQKAFDLVAEYVPPDREVLMLACVCGSATTVQVCLNHGLVVSLSGDGTEGYQPLHMAAFNMHLHIVRILFDSVAHSGLDNAQVANKRNNRGETPLGATLTGFRNLLQNKHPIQLSMQTSSAITRFEDVVRLLLDNGARATGTTWDDDANVQPKMVSPIGIACSIGNLKIVRGLVERAIHESADENSIAFNPTLYLFTALDGNHAEVVRFLVEHGADPMQTRLLNAMDPRARFQPDQARAEDYARMLARSNFVQGAPIRAAGNSDSDISTIDHEDDGCTWVTVSSSSAGEDSDAPTSEGSDIVRGAPSKLFKRGMVVQYPLESALAVHNGGPELLQAMLESRSKVEINHRSLMVAAKAWSRQLFFGSSLTKSNFELLLDHDSTAVVPIEALRIIADERRERTGPRGRGGQSRDGESGITITNVESVCDRIWDVAIARSRFKSAEEFEAAERSRSRSSRAPRAPLLVSDWMAQTGRFADAEEPFLSTDDEE